MENPVRTKSFNFALQVVLLCKDLQKENEYVISRQLLRSWTSIGANVEEAQWASSRKDFLNKIRIAKKEAFETKYWLRLLKESQIISKDYSKYIQEVGEIIRILGKITSTMSKD